MEPSMNTLTKKWLLSYAVAAVIFAVLNLVWISFVASALYQSQIVHMIASKPNPTGAVAFYVLFVAVTVHYGVRPNDPDATMRQRVAGAGLLGFFTFAVWALTAFDVLKDVPAFVVVTDILWGAASCSLATWLTVTVLRRALVKDRSL
jgi:uncharacterized membrane protein